MDSIIAKFKLIHLDRNVFSEFPRRYFREDSFNKPSSELIESIRPIEFHPFD